MHAPLPSFIRSVSNARHHPRPRSTCMRGSVMGRRVHDVVRCGVGENSAPSFDFSILFGYCFGYGAKRRLTWVAIIKEYPRGKQVEIDPRVPVRLAEVLTNSC